PTAEAENMAGVEPDPKPGVYIAVTITASAPAAIPAWNAGSCTDCHVDSDSGSVGIATCGSPAWPPRPGKCFTVAPTPPSCSPCTAAPTSGATTAVFEPNERAPMIASRGLVRP